ncbi:MAG: hypothetical protein RL885_00190 [Planctomycetota bacterium]
MRYVLIILGLIASAAAAQPHPQPELFTWPNEYSRANSDPWIAEHHGQILEMKPKLLVINFSNQLSPDDLERQTQKLIDALAESSRYHGFENEEAPPFLRYEVFKTVDLRDLDRTKGNCSRSPIKPGIETGINMDYSALYSERFTQWYDVKDPDDASRRLSLAEMVDRGLVHEVWFFICVDDWLRCYECIEIKPVYDETFKKVGDAHRHAGNGEDPDLIWTGRSLRFNGINHERGTGCAMENLGHSLEGMAHSNVIPYFKRYFYEFAGFDLDTRYDLPFNSFYPLWGDGKSILYPEPDVALIERDDEYFRLEGYVACGGNVHFPPNGRRHYDMSNDTPVLSTIEDWRIGSGENGEDLAKPWTSEVLAPYLEVAPDCMGAWLVYWRQCMPGLMNEQRDDEGKPMKNWWPFLFY